MRLFDLIQLQEQRLEEVNMSPTNLRLLASKISAQGGMEFEMCVPNISEGEEGEFDYDMDERVHSFDDIENFFMGGEGFNSRQQVSRAISSMQDDYMEWYHEQKGEAWANDQEESVRDYIVQNDWDEDAERRNWIENNFDVTDEEIDNIIEAGEDRVDRDRMDSDPEYKRRLQIYKEASDAIELELDAKVESAIDDQDSNYENAYEEWEDNWEGGNDISEEDWFHSQGYRYMTDVEQAYDLTWPYLQEGGADIEMLADEFGSDLGVKVNWSSSYHGGNRKPDTWVIEPDGSIDTDGDGAGLEFVSPPMPIPQMIDSLESVVSWAKKKGCYTNDSTGLHMNVSVPGYSYDNLDYVKLALFLGDEHVLSEFGRESNTYCKSAISKIRSKIDPNQTGQILDQFSKNLNTLAAKNIHGGITDKYTSINTKDKYVEFRSPGGDWLNEDLTKLTNTMLRFVVALNIAIDRDAYKQEYAKKLYKLLSPADDGTNTLQLFSDFKAGKIDREQLISNVKSAGIQRDIKRGRAEGKLFWWRVEKEGRNAPNGAVLELVAASKDEALQKASAEWDIRLGALTRASVTPIKPYTGSKLEQPAEPQASDDSQARPGQMLAQTDYENRLGWGSQSADANYEIVDRRTLRRQFVFIANTPQDAERKYTQWLDLAGFPHDTENFGWRPIQR